MRPNKQQNSKYKPKHIKNCCCLVLKSCLTFVTPWTVACQTPLAMGSSRQEYWSGLPFPPPWDLPDPGIEPMSPESPAVAGGFWAYMPTNGLAHHGSLI